jgi:hypothetical protein
VLFVALTAVDIYIFIQAYVSTVLSANTVLVWAPLTLVLDAGSLLQILVLIVEEISLPRFLRTVGKILAWPWTQIRSRYKNQGPLVDIRTQRYG